MDVNQTSVAFGSAAQLAYQAQRSVQDERDSVQRATGNSAAADTTEVADVRSDAPPDDDVEAAPPRSVAEADDSERAGPERERGSVFDLMV
jgi:hypothetical protein